MHPEQACGRDGTLRLALSVSSEPLLTLYLHRGGDDARLSGKASSLEESAGILH